MRIASRLSWGAAAAGIAGATWVARALWGLPSALGASATAIQSHALGGGSYRDRQFHNTEPSVPATAEAARSLLYSVLTRRHVGRPNRPVPLATPEVPAIAADLAVTWYGHATALIEVDGYRILTDPVWSKRVSPSRLVGPARLHPVPVALTELPPVDAVIISHDHYDHLDKDTIAQLCAASAVPFIVPMGIGAHLRHWGVPTDRIIELDWDGSVTLSALGRDRSGADLRITCTEARHFSGRGFVRNTTLWASWAVSGPTHRVYFGGDTGYTKAFASAGATHGPFDLTLLPIGAYDLRWQEVHMNPEEAVRAHADLCLGDPGYGMLVPIHWATFNLAFHDWSEPVRRMVAAAAAAGTKVAVPRPGQRVWGSVRAESLSPAHMWWKNVD